MLPALLLASAAAASLGLSDDPQTIPLTLTSKDAYTKLGYIQGLAAEILDAKPDLIKKAPADLKNPRYAVVRFGDMPLIGNDGAPEPWPADHKPAPDAASFAVIIDEPDGGPSRLFADTNRDGDLTNDPAPEWAARDEKGWDGSDLKTWTGSAPFNLGSPGGAGADKPRTVNLGFFRFDPKDQRRAQLTKYLVTYRDYLAVGELRLGDRTLPFSLSDELATGVFHAKAATPPAADAPADLPDEAPANPFASGLTLLIDVNNNGRIDYKGEAYDALKPFNIGGVTYQLSDIAPDGSSVKLSKPATAVAEIKPPPDHAVGKKITPFDATRLDGKKVAFPADYKGKIVLIDFWATWCAPCMHEVPNVVAAYQKLKDKGFDVLGVSLDDKDALDRLKQVTAEKQMAWPQVCDGKAWRSDLAGLYAVTSIPACWLVDGDTGLIVADAATLRGEQLTATIESALSKKSTK